MDIHGSQEGQYPSDFQSWQDLLEQETLGENTNLNQLAKQANTYGFFAVTKRCEEMAQRINHLIKQLKDDR